MLLVIPAFLEPVQRDELRVEVVEQLPENLNQMVNELQNKTLSFIASVSCSHAIFFLKLRPIRL